MKIISCASCGYERSSEQDGRSFEDYCMSCDSPEDECFCQWAKIVVVCSDCAR